MSHSEQQSPFPRGPLLGAAGLVLFSLLSVAWLRWFGEAPAVAPPAEPPVAARDLRFEDLDSGAVGVYDAASGRLIRQLESGEHGFLRSTLRGMARARKARNAGPETPFRIELRSTGRLLLIDPVTGQEVDLWAFGAVNAQAFATFLAEPPAQAAGG